MRLWAFKGTAILYRQHWHAEKQDEAKTMAPPGFRLSGERSRATGLQRLSGGARAALIKPQAAAELGMSPHRGRSSFLVT